MRMTIPFQYHGWYIERGKRSQISVYLAGETIVNLRELPPEAAPVAAAVVDVSGLEPKLAPMGNKPRRVRHADGAFWRELMPAEEFREMVEKRWEERGDEEWTARQHDNPFVYPGKGVLGWVPGIETKTRAQIEEERQVQIREWSDDGGEQRAIDIRLRANSVIVVDGAVYERCPEPCWKLHVSGDEVVVHASFASPEQTREQFSDLKTVLQGHSPLPTPDSVFCITRGGDAVEFARDVAARTEAGKVRVAAKAQIAAPAAFCLPDDHMAAEAAAKLIADWCGEHLNYVPREAVRSYCALRDAWEAAGQTLTVEVGEALAQVAETWRAEAARAGEWVVTREDYGSMYSAFRRDGFLYGNANRNHMAAAVSMCRNAAARWERRPDDGREWVHLREPLAPVAAPFAVGEVLTLHAARQAALELGADLEAEASAAADGRCRLVAAREGGRLVAVAVVDPRTGVVERSVGPGGRGASPAACAALAKALDVAPADAPVLARGR